MAKGKGNKQKKDEKIWQKKDEVEGISRQNSEIILGMSSEGFPTETIARICNIKSTEVVKIIGATDAFETAQDSGSSSQADGEQGLTPLVKRLLADPKELCCPISHQLMEDPVVAGDGFTYERSWVEESFKSNSKSPMTGKNLQTHVLHQNQKVKSDIVSFKEHILTEILRVAPKLHSSQSNQALALVQRGEQFLRPLLPDISARKKLAALLLIQIKLPGVDRDAILQELVSLLVVIENDEQLQDFLGSMQVSDLGNVLPKLQDEMIESLHNTAKSSEVLEDFVAQHLAGRLAGRLGDATCLKKLWKLLSSNSKAGEDPWAKWAKAAGIILAAFPDRLEHSVPLSLSQVDERILLHASTFAEDQTEAIAFAKGFFQYDLGISTTVQWPPKGCAMIFMELFTRLPSGDDKHQEKLQLLQTAHEIDDTDAVIRQTLTKELHQCLLRTESPGARSSINVEELFLQLILVNDDKVPADVMDKLTLEETQLKELSAEQLQLLSEQLGISRCVDAARLAVKAAKLFAGEDRQSESQDAFLQAFLCDRNNDDAAVGLVQTIRKMKEELQEKHESIEKLSHQCTEIQTKCQRRTNEENVPQGLGQNGVPLMTFVWDLSCYDFTSFQEKQEQCSDNFPLPGFNTNAWLSFYPKSHAKSKAGWAALFFYVDSDVRVKATFCAPGREKQFDHDYATMGHKKDGTPQGCGFANFMPVSEAESCTSITLRIFSVQPSGSTVRLVAPGSS